MKIKLTEKQVNLVIREGLKKAISLKLSEYEVTELDDYLLDLIKTFRYFSDENEYREFLSSKQHTKFFKTKFNYD